MSDPREAYEQSEALRGSPDSREPRPDAPDSPADAGEREPASGAQTATAGDNGSDPVSSSAPGDGAGPEPLRDDERGGDAPGNDTPEGDVAGRDPAELAAALQEAQRQRDEYLDHLRRERAEFDNFRKRNAKERLEAMDRGVQSLVTELLGVLDNFGHVLKAAEDSPDEALAKGARMVHEELVGVLARFGLEDVPGAGEPFDPQWHEAMMQVPAEEDVDGPVVAEVLRAGYRFKGRVLRPASVSVAQ